MAFPDPSIPAPALSDYQASYRGITFGGFTGSYQLGPGGLDGMGVTTIQSGDQQRTLENGEWAGVDLSAGRDIPIDIIITADSTSLDHARQQLGAVFQPAGATEYPLFIQLPSGTFACMARPRKFPAKLDKTTIQAGATPIPVLLHATDDKWYASPSKQASVALPTITSGGLTVAADVPWVLGTGSAAGLLDVWNLGTVAMRPILIINGPCANPTIANQSIAGTPALGFDVTLNAGDTLEVDMDLQTVILTTAGSSEGSPREDLEANGSVWWDLLPSDGPDGIGAANTLAFTGSGTGLLTVQSADAYPAI